LLFKEQSKGAVRTDIDPALLSALLLTLIRGMYNPGFFLTYSVPSDIIWLLTGINLAVFIPGMIAPLPVLGIAYVFFAAYRENKSTCAPYFMLQ
jgi:hypothetical protein